MLGLPEATFACLFDLDGVLTRTAAQHAQAWKEMFDDFLRARAEETGAPFRPFAVPADYDQYVDGKPRVDGVTSFLGSRDIELPLGTPADAPDARTAHGLANRKNDRVLELIRTQGVDVFEGSVRYVELARRAGMRCAVVSSSKNCRDVLASVGIDHFFEAVVDGNVVEREGLPGKPAPDTFLAAARALDTEPPHAAVFEDALAGVEAGRAGGFGYVVGVDRSGQAEALEEHGADIVVSDLSELLEKEPA
jgi:beta-phosphoglucomutase family hydrolase